MSDEHTEHDDAEKPIRTTIDLPPDLIAMIDRFRETLKNETEELADSNVSRVHAIRVALRRYLSSVEKGARRRG